jgi:hypothetical protein
MTIPKRRPRISTFGSRRPFSPFFLNLCPRDQIHRLAIPRVAVTELGGTFHHMHGVGRQKEVLVLDPGKITILNLPSASLMTEQVIVRYDFK